MDSKKLSKVISFFREELVKGGVRPLKIFVFGSQIREDVSNDSDLDIIVVSEDFSGKNIFERSLLTKDAEIMTIKKFWIPLDILTFSPEEYENEESLILNFVKDEEQFYGK